MHFPINFTLSDHSISRKIIKLQTIIYISNTINWKIIVYESPAEETRQTKEHFDSRFHFHAGFKERIRTCQRIIDSSTLEPHRSIFIFTVVVHKLASVTDRFLEQSPIKHGRGHALGNSEQIICLGRSNTLPSVVITPMTRIFVEFRNPPSCVSNVTFISVRLNRASFHDGFTKRRCSSLIAPGSMRKRLEWFPESASKFAA